MKISSPVSCSSFSLLRRLLSLQLFPDEFDDFFALTISGGRSFHKNMDPPLVDFNIVFIFIAFIVIVFVLRAETEVPMSES